MMKKQENEVRNKVVKIRMNDSEKKQLKKFQQQSTERNVSNYVRKVSLHQPVIIKYRNQSADDFLRDMIDLKKQLNGVGNNFNQAVKKLHLLHQIPEFRSWIKEQQSLQQVLITNIETIRLRITQLYEQWLQK